MSFMIPPGGPAALSPVSGQSGGGHGAPCLSGCASRSVSGPLEEPDDSMKLLIGNYKDTDRTKELRPMRQGCIGRKSERKEVRKKGSQY